MRIWCLLRTTLAITAAATPSRLAAQIGSPSDPICRLPMLFDGLEITGRMEYDVKAALLYRCVELVQWPPETLAADPSTLRIGILGKNQFGQSLDCLKGKRVAGRKLVVTKISRVTQAARCQMVFVSGSESNKVSQILSALATAPVVTIGETAGFTEQGGMLNFLLSGRSIRLELNQAAAEKARIVLDPKLVQLAALFTGPKPAQTNSSESASPKS